jgi:phosphomannomutase
VYVLAFRHTLAISFFRRKRRGIIPLEIKNHYRHVPGLIDIDGVRIPFADGWALVRSSNTQPVIVLRFEASSVERLKKIRQEVETLIDI